MMVDIRQQEDTGAPGAPVSGFILDRTTTELVLLWPRHPAGLLLAVQVDLLISALADEVEHEQQVTDRHRRRHACGNLKRLAAPVDDSVADRRLILFDVRRLDGSPPRHQLLQ